MLCVRCSHELPSRADRCLRCFALNPQNRPAPRTAPLALSFDSDPGPAAARAETPVDPQEAPTEPPEPEWAMSDLEEAALAYAPHLALHEPDLISSPSAPIDSAPPAPVLYSMPPAQPAIAPRVLSIATPLPPEGAPAPAPSRAAASLLPAQLLAWSIDLALVLICAALHVALAALVLGLGRLAPAQTGSADYWVDLLLFTRRLPLLWTLLAASLALSYSWLFAALGGRTPGMALARLRLVSEQGGSPSPARALFRAAISLPSAALGLAGFALALFDPRGQTLHDKLARTVVVAD